MGWKYDFYITVFITFADLSLFLCLSYSRSCILFACKVYWGLIYFSTPPPPPPPPSLILFRVIDSRQHYSYLCPVESTLLAFYIMLLFFYAIVFLFIIWDTGIFLFLLYQRKGEVQLGKPGISSCFFYSRIKAVYFSSNWLCFSIFLSQ